MAGARARMFPVGLYATLLGALCWLAVPQLTVGVEQVLLGGASLPLRGYASVFGESGGLAGVAAEDRELAQELLVRQEAAAVDFGTAVGLQGREPLVCRVLEARGVGGAGLVAELVLDRSYRELAGSERFVTHGDRLIGFLARPGEGILEEEGEEDLARVLLLNHEESPVVPSSIRLNEGRDLRCVVEPAGTVDRWPLRCALWEDPYVASTLASGGGEVRSLATTGLNAVGVPGGLLVGTCQVWGYELGDERLPIGLYVQPVMEPRTISTAVLWRSARAGGGEGIRTPVGGAVTPVRLLRVPAPSGERVFAYGDWSRMYPSGAALVRGLRLRGVLSGLGPGQALVHLVEESSRVWSLTLLPEAGPPVELRGRFAEREAGGVWVEVVGRERGQIGQVFTGVNGLHCPAGLLVGEVRQVAADGARILVDRPTELFGSGGQGVFVFAGGGS